MAKFIHGWVLAIDATECTPELFVVATEKLKSGFSTKTETTYSTTTQADEATVFQSGVALQCAQTVVQSYLKNEVRIKHCIIERSVKIGHYATTAQEFENVGTD